MRMVYLWKIIVVRSDDGGEFSGGDLGGVCKLYCIEQEFTSTKCPGLNSVAGRALGTVEDAAPTARI